MKHTVTRLRATALTAVITVPALLFAGCVEQPNADGGSAASASCVVSPDTEFSGTLRIAYQAIPNADLVVRDQGLLEACLPNADIQWNQFSSGGDVVQAFGSGSLDLGLAGSSPSTKAVSAPLSLDLQVVWVHDVIGEAESLVTRDSGVTAIGGLKGKTIAVPFGSTSHFSLMFALEQAGMAATDVNLINLDPEKMPAAWQGGQIDAAWVWDPVLTKLTDAGGTVVTSSAETAQAGAPTSDMELASKSFIKENPEVLRVWTGVQDAAVQQIMSDPQKATDSIAAQLGVSPDTVSVQLKGYTYMMAKDQSEFFHNKLPGVMKETATFLKGQGSIDAVSDDYAPALYTSAMDAVAGQ